MLPPPRAGAELKENHAVKTATFDKSKGLWTVSLEKSDETFTVSTSGTQYYNMCIANYVVATRSDLYGFNKNFNLNA